MPAFTKSLLLCLGTLALGASLASGAGLRVATFRSDVTPAIDGHPLIWTKPAKEIEDRLWAKGIILDDGQNRYVLCAVDWCGLCNSTYELFRGKLAKAVGTDPTHVAVQTVHQHTAPYTDGDAQKLLDAAGNPPKFVDFPFLEEITDRLAAAAKAALEQLQPFDSVGLGQAEVHQVAATRRVMGPDGKIIVRYSSCKDPVLAAAPEGRIDRFLKTVTLAQGTKPLVRLHYYATHPQTFYGDARVSTDTAGHARDQLEKEEGVFQIYFNGCGGDITLGKYNDGSRAAREPLTARLLAGMKAAVAATQFQPAEKLLWHHVAVTFDKWTDGNFSRQEAEAAVRNGKGDGRVRSACLLAYHNRTAPYDLSCLEIGKARLLNLPGECLIEFQFFAQQQLPENFVAVAAYGDLSTGYICPEEAFAQGGYEPTDANTPPSSEAKLKGAIRELLGTR